MLSSPVIYPLSLVCFFLPLVAAKNYGPLTTTFTPPSSCFFTTAYFSTSATRPPDGAFGLALIPQWMTTTVSPNAYASCYPSGYRTIGLQQDYFSPGLVCPLGYVSGVPVTNTDSHVTGVVCCPGGFMPGVLGDVCHKVITGELLASAVLQNGVGTTEFPFLSVISSDYVLVGTSTYTIDALGVSLRWEASDLPSPSNATAGEPGGSETASATSTDAKETSARLSGTSSSGLSQGAKIGIGVGVPLAFLAILAGIFAFILRKRHRRRIAGNTQFENVDDSPPPPPPVENKLTGKSAEINVTNGPGSPFLPLAELSQDNKATYENEIYRPVEHTAVPHPMYETAGPLEQRRYETAEALLIETSVRLSAPEHSAAENYSARDKW